MTPEFIPHDPLHLIDLDQPLPGQRRFISCWAHLGGDVTFIVDPGPPDTVDRLVAELEGRGLRDLDFILLTHVHLDHAGGTSRILERWPRARVICHEEGRRHLVDPSQLWAGSRQALGSKAEVYGEPAPVPAAALAGSDAAAARGITVIPTPGHAAHHVAFRYGDDLFVGEAAGTFSTLGRGPATESPYLRPATPKRYFPAVARASLERLLDLEPVPRRLLFAHHGQFTGDARALLIVALDQLGLWLTTCERVLTAFRALPHTEQGEDALHDAITAELRRVDPLFARGGELPADIRRRERDFTRQTLRGMLDHLLTAGGEA